MLGDGPGLCGGDRVILLVPCAAVTVVTPESLAPRQLAVPP